MNPLFTCPKCGSTAFDSERLLDNTLDRRCLGFTLRDGIRAECSFAWNERDDHRYMRGAGPRAIGLKASGLGATK